MFNFFSRRDEKKSGTTYIEKINMIEKYEEDVPQEVFAFLRNKLVGLKIDIMGRYRGTIIDLMKSEFLIHWCEQVVESVVVFLDEADIKKGYLHLENDNKFNHRWITFEYGKKAYVFDPCLEGGIIVREKKYNKVFETDIVSSVTANDVRKKILVEHANNCQSGDLEESSKYATYENIVVQGKVVVAMTAFFKK